MSGRRLGEPMLPFRPLYEASGCTTIGQFAEHVGQHLRNVHRHQRRGILLRTADGWAAQFGFHPRQVWGETYDMAVELMGMWADMQHARRAEQYRLQKRKERARPLWDWEWDRIDLLRENDRKNQMFRVAA